MAASEPTRVAKAESSASLPPASLWPYPVDPPKCCHFHNQLTSIYLFNENTLNFGKISIGFKKEVQATNKPACMLK
jgi:hypothetical protein